MSGFGFKAALRVPEETVEVVEVVGVSKTGMALAMVAASVCKSRFLRGSHGLYIKHGRRLISPIH
jgi:hypothetical protein